jgi:hypothetical protein
MKACTISKKEGKNQTSADENQIKNAVNVVNNYGVVAQLGERCPCTADVGSSNLPSSTNLVWGVVVLEN